MKKLTEDELARACHMYRTDTDASRALQISNERFKRYCTEFDLETPTQRFNRETTERKERQAQNKAHRAPISLPARRIPFPTRSRRNKHIKRSN